MRRKRCRQHDRNDSTLRLRFWLLALDVLAWRWYGSPAYLWAVRKAADASDWEEAP